MHRRHTHVLVKYFYFICRPNFSDFNFFFYITTTWYLEQNWVVKFLKYFLIDFFHSPLLKSMILIFFIVKKRHKWDNWTVHRDRSTHSDVSYETEFEAYFFSSRCFLNKKLWQSLFFVYICVAYMSDYFFLSFSSRARVFFFRKRHMRKKVMKWNWLFSHGVLRFLCCRSFLF